MQLNIIYSFSQFTHPLCSYGHTSSIQYGSPQLDKKINAIKYNLYILFI